MYRDHNLKYKVVTHGISLLDIYHVTPCYSVLLAIAILFLLHQTRFAKFNTASLITPRSKV